VLLVARFDRDVDAEGRVVRRHQEDFAQALGLPATLKYERHGTPLRRFDAAAIRRILDATVDPVEERDRFIRSTLFDLLIGNVDAHAKNHALIHQGLNRVRVAPRYDLLPTRLDPDLTDELPFKIGNASTLAAITRHDFNAFLATMGIVRPGAQRRTTARHAPSLAEGLAGVLAELNAKGMKAFADLIASNLRVLMPILGLAVPAQAKDRDAFAARGGGWLNG
jgi:serine/threonine-protein kinase HipA